MQRKTLKMTTVPMTRQSCDIIAKL